MLVGLGAFHGINPAMGWLFAVALGLHRNSRAVLLLSLLPIALGHALAIGVIVGIFGAAGVLLDQRLVRTVAGVALIAWAFCHRLYGSRHRVRVGLRTGYAGLFLWSAFMGTAHGAGLMLLPALLSLGVGGAHADPAHGHAHGIDGSIDGSLALAAAAVGVHSLAMLGVTGLAALVVYEWVGVGFLRRGWVNLDLLWTASLLAAGAILLMP